MNFIIDPANGIRYELFSTNGKNLLKQYVKYVQSGGVLLPKDKEIIRNDINEVLNSLRPVTVTMQWNGQTHIAKVEHTENVAKVIYTPTDILVGLHEKYKDESTLLKYNEKMRYTASLIMHKISKVENEKYKKKYEKLINDELKTYKPTIPTYHDKHIIKQYMDTRKSELEADDTLKTEAETENQLIFLNGILNDTDYNYKTEFEKACTGENCQKLVEELCLYETNPIFDNIKPKQFKFSLLGPNSNDSKHLDLLIFVKKTDFILTNKRIKERLNELLETPRYRQDRNEVDLTGRVGRGGKNIPAYNTKQAI